MTPCVKLNGTVLLCWIGDKTKFGPEVFTDKDCVTVVNSILTLTLLKVIILLTVTSGPVNGDRKRKNRAWLAIAGISDMEYLPVVLFAV